MSHSISYYKKLLPKKLSIQIRKEEGEFWAEIKEFPHCYTQAKTFWELIKMINDAIYTHFDIPENFREKLGYYLPEEIAKKIQDDAMRKHWQGVIEEIVGEKELKKKSETFQLT